MNQIDFYFVSRQLESSRFDVSVRGDARAGQVVSIGRRLHLAAMTPANLRSLGLPVSLQRKLAPFLGKSGAELAANLRWQPLRLSSNEKAAILAFDSTDTIRRLESRYIGGAANRRRASFGSLPAVAQTALATLVLKFGVELDRSMPSVWRAFCAQKWDAARAELEARRAGDSTLVQLLARLD